MQNCCLKVAISFVSRFNRFSGKTNAKRRTYCADWKTNSYNLSSVEHECLYELSKRRSSQLLTQLTQLRKESLKKSVLPEFEPWPLRYRCSALTIWANKPTGSWSLNWFVIYPEKMKMKLWIHEIHIFKLRNEEMNVEKILAVINASYAVAKRKPEKIRLAGIRTLTRVTWSLKLNIVFLYLLNRKVNYISGRFLTRNFELLFWMEGAQ